jgi:hypothetical protein
MRDFLFFQRQTKKNFAIFPATEKNRKKPRRINHLISVINRFYFFSPNPNPNPTPISPPFSAKKEKKGIDLVDTGGLLLLVLLVLSLQMPGIKLQSPREALLWRSIKKKKQLDRHVCWRKYEGGRFLALIAVSQRLTRG